MRIKEQAMETLVLIVALCISMIMPLPSRGIAAQKCGAAELEAARQALEVSDLNRAEKLALGLADCPQQEGAAAARILQEIALRRKDPGISPGGAEENPSEAATSPGVLETVDPHTRLREPSSMGDSASSERLPAEEELKRARHLPARSLEPKPEQSEARSSFSNMDVRLQDRDLRRRTVFGPDPRPELEVLQRAESPAFSPVESRPVPGTTLPAGPGFVEVVQPDNSAAPSMEGDDRDLDDRLQIAVQSYYRGEYAETIAELKLYLATKRRPDLASLAHFYLGASVAASSLLEHRDTPQALETARRHFRSSRHLDSGLGPPLQSVSPRIRALFAEAVAQVD